MIRGRSRRLSKSRLHMLAGLRRRALCRSQRCPARRLPATISSLTSSSTLQWIKAASVAHQHTCWLFKRRHHRSQPQHHSNSKITSRPNTRGQRKTGSNDRRGKRSRLKRGGHKSKPINRTDNQHIAGVNLVKSSGSSKCSKHL